MEYKRLIVKLPSDFIEGLVIIGDSKMWSEVRISSPGGQRKRPCWVREQWSWPRVHWVPEVRGQASLLLAAHPTARRGFGTKVRLCVPLLNGV